ncbi:hypothetical protein BX661DRAFT_181218 [Kickxella alabastrina]|uniref:uncharacterized protein n=1 Tax=Kickxella alabastrina TaxID=61397 RepID=UPI00221ECEB8|nr:uncharacterized protein BX661DRAFT_181218 [Kickxella alabastrina]KAI7830162.1 hypothetical protein BX661DRAFT_181218 [Kickxella alabastrina]
MPATSGISIIAAISDALLLVPALAEGSFDTTCCLADLCVGYDISCACCVGEPSFDNSRASKIAFALSTGFWWLRGITNTAAMAEALTESVASRSFMVICNNYNNNNSNETGVCLCVCMCVLL